MAAPTGHPCTEIISGPFAYAAGGDVLENRPQWWLKVKEKLLPPVDKSVSNHAAIWSSVRKVYIQQSHNVFLVSGKEISTRYMEQRKEGN